MTTALYVLRVRVSLAPAERPILNHLDTKRAFLDAACVPPPPGLYLGWLHAATRPVVLRVDPDASLALARFQYWNDGGGVCTADQQRKRLQREAKRERRRQHQTRTGVALADLCQRLVVVPFPWPGDTAHAVPLAPYPIELQRSTAAAFFETLPANTELAWLGAFVRFVMAGRPTICDPPQFPLLEAALTSFSTFQPTCFDNNK